MPGTTAVPDIEIVVEDIGGGGGGPTPPPAGGDDGDGGGDDRNRRRKWPPSPKPYSTALTIGIVSILMFFMALASAFIVLRRGSDLWVTVHLPRILWANTGVLLASSFTLESARRRLFLADASGFHKFWLMTTALGFLFVAGQLVAWRQLAAPRALRAGSRRPCDRARRTAAADGAGKDNRRCCRFFSRSRISVAHRAVRCGSCIGDRRVRGLPARAAASRRESD